LAAIDITNPLQPSQVALVSASHALNGLVIGGHYVFAISPKAGLFVYDIADPAHPQQVGRLPGIQAEGIALMDRYAYLATTAGIQAVNVSDPRRPALATLTAIPRAVESLAVAGHYIYLSVMPGALLIADAADPAAPRLVGGVNIPTYTKNLQVVGDKVYIANGNNGVAIVDAADPDHPRLLSTTKVGALVTDVAAVGNLIMATDVSEGGFHVLRGSDSEKLAEVSAYRAPGLAHDVVVQDHYAYLATGMDGDLTILDYSDLANPVGVGFYRTPAHTSLVRVHGDRLYAYTQHNAIQVLDVNDPTRPIDLGTRELSTGTRVVAVDDYLSFFSDDAGMLHIYDATSTGMPQEVGLFAVAGEVNDAAMTDTFVLVASGTHDVLAARYSGATAPVPFERIPIPGNAQHVVAEDSAAYVLTEDGTLFALDLATLGDIQITDRLALGIDASAIKLYDGHLYLPAGEDGVYIVDVSHPGVFGSLTVYDTPGTALNLEVRANHIFVADGYAGLILLALTGQAEPTPALPVPPAGSPDSAVYRPSGG
jgi:hypothetical protein